MAFTSDTRLATAAERDNGARRLMLVVLLAGQFMALLDVTIVNVAMPTIGRSLAAAVPLTRTLLAARDGS
ncbi:MAG TPA: hypothetical protein VKG80_11845 [Trebonia sp.]|nr:hypothetical protein [Trebonia sp.]